MPHRGEPVNVSGRVGCQAPRRSGVPKHRADRAGVVVAPSLGTLPERLGGAEVHEALHRRIEPFLVGHEGSIVLVAQRAEVELVASRESLEAEGGIGRAAAGGLGPVCIQGIPILLEFCFKIENVSDLDQPYTDRYAIGVD